MSASNKEVSKATVMVTARARKKPRDLGHGDQRKKNNDRGNGGKDQGRLISWIALRTDHPRLSRFPVNRNVLDHHDGIVDNQPDGRGQTAQGHQVEALAGDAEKENGHRDGDRDDQAGDQRRSPVARETGRG